MTTPATTTANNLLYFEDIHIGQQFITDGYSVDAEHIKNFAKQFDPQPFHLDEQLARQTIFKGLVASGWHTAAISMKLIVESIGVRFAGGIIGKQCQISWPSPTYPNDSLHVECEVESIESAINRPHWGIVKLRCHTFNQNKQIVQILVAEIIIHRKNQGE